MTRTRFSSLARLALSPMAAFVAVPPSNSSPASFPANSPEQKRQSLLCGHQFRRVEIGVSVPLENSHDRHHGSHRTASADLRIDVALHLLAPPVLGVRLGQAHHGR